LSAFLTGGDLAELEQTGDPVVGCGVAPLVDEMVGETGERMRGLAQGLPNDLAFGFAETEGVVADTAARVGESAEGGGDPLTGEDLVGVERFGVGEWHVALLQWVQPDWGAVTGLRPIPWCQASRRVWGQTRAPSGLRIWKWR